MIPDDSFWNPMETAPQDGTIIIVRYHPKDALTGRFDQTTWKVQPAQWLCDEHGKNWGWAAPHRVGSSVFALGWVPLAALAAAQKLDELAREKQATPEFDL